MSFEANQRAYYLSELNRALPTNSSTNDYRALNLALESVDPVMPGDTKQEIRVDRYISEFGANSNAYQKDAACRAYPYPSAGMRAPDARTGCGWWYAEDPKSSSVGAYGTRRGPMSPTLDRDVGPGEWIWDTGLAYQKESMKEVAKVKSCGDMKFQKDKNVGWCKRTGRAIVLDADGYPKYPKLAGGDCPRNDLIPYGAPCPSTATARATSTSTARAAPSITDICQPVNGSLSNSCLESISSRYCSANGTLSKALTTGYAAMSDTFNASNKYLTERGFSLHAGILRDGKLTVNDAINSVTALKNMTYTGDGQSKAAAANLCYGTAFDPCAISPHKSGPYDQECIKAAAIRMGYNPSSKFLPPVNPIDVWNKLTTWQNVLDTLEQRKRIADTASNDRNAQLRAISDVYNVTVKNPAKGCNINGILMYRYYFPTMDASNFPIQGAQTPFLGRYILKDGFTNQLAPTTQEQTPAGVFNKEAQRMITQFSPDVTGTYQFLVTTASAARIQLNGTVVAQINQAGKSTTSTIVTLNAGLSYPLVVDLWNGTGRWSFLIQVAINGKLPWQSINPLQLYMPYDWRLPMIDLAFHKMPIGTTGAIKDTNNLLQALQISNTSVGSLNGKTCLVVNGPGQCVDNHARITQGIRLRAMKSFTLMLLINDARWQGSPMTPGIVDFYNLPSANTTAASRQQFTYYQRPQDFLISCSKAQLYPFGLQTSIGRRGFDKVLNEYIYVGMGVNIPNAQWFHYTFVWDEDGAGFTQYINGKADKHVLGLQPYESNLIMDHFSIGCDPRRDGQTWMGGIQWFRAFDYALTQEFIDIDMKDAWASL